MLANWQVDQSAEGGQAMPEVTFKPNCPCRNPRIKVMPDKHTDEPRVYCSCCGEPFLRVSDKTDALNEAMAYSLTYDGVP